MDIIKIIRDNKLIYLKIDKLATQLKFITGRSIEDLKHEIVSLIHSGDLLLEENGKVSISADKGLYKAKLILNKKGYGFAVVEGFNDFFIPAFAINGAFDGDDCLVEITSRKGDDEIEGKVVRVLKRNTTHIVGTLVIGKSKNVVFPDDERLPQIRIFKDDIGKAKNNEKVYVALDMDSLETSNVHGKIEEILGMANTPKAEQLSIIRSYDLIEKFDDSTLTAARAISQTVDKKHFKNRVDFTEHRVITIDGEDARDFDDALSVECLENGGYNLYVHIADVSNYVVENSPLDKEAYRRGTSVYFPNLVIPMLPKELSNGICSLSEGVNRLVLSVEINLDKNARVMSSKVVEGVIKSSHRMTYTEIKNILDGDELLVEKYADVYNDIMTYRDISKKLKTIRFARGEIRMNLPEPFILENEAGEIISIENRVQDEAHEIIESLMILANECVAKKYYDLKLPFVYRVHEKPDEQKALRLSTILKNMGVSNDLENVSGDPKTCQAIMEKIQDTPKEETLTKLILRSMMKARYAPTCLGHFGLASEFYCHFTSPIRRYPDLMIHRIIKQYINGVPIDELRTKYTPIVERACEQSSKTEKTADEAEREVDDYKKSVYMSKFLGETFTGTISGVQEFGIFVELENGIEGMVRVDSLPMDEYVYDDLSMTMKGKYHTFNIGDKINVIVASTNIRLHQINFDIEGVEANLGAFVVNKNKSKKPNKSTRKSNSRPNRKTEKSTKSKRTKRQKRR